jgi:hypothetical protein
MADDGSAATLARLVGCYGLPPGDAQVLLAGAARVSAAPSGALFSTPTTLLSRVLRVLKNAAPTAHRAVVEDCFMALVTKVGVGERACGGPTATRATPPVLS